MTKTAKFIPLFILIAIAMLVWASGIYNYINIESFKQNEALLRSYVKEYYIPSICIFCLLYFIIVALSIPVATVMTLIGGFLFDQLIATICIVISASFGACIIFLSTKIASKNAVQKDMGKWSKKMQDGFQANSFSYMLTLRLIPIFPFVIVNLVAGFMQIPLRNFFFGTLIGIIPATSIYVSVGVSMRELLNRPNFSINNLLDPQILVSLSGLGLLALLPVIYKKFKKK